MSTDSMEKGIQARIDTLIRNTDAYGAVPQIFYDLKIELAEASLDITIKAEYETKLEEFHATVDKVRLAHVRMSYGSVVE